MSQELADEVEAINSIYGEGCLIQSADDPAVYVLDLPGDETSSLRLRFPAAYPEEPPSVVGTNSSGEHGKRGIGARDLSLFRDAVGTVFQPGMVCLFDSVEEFNRLLELYVEEHEEPPTPADQSDPGSEDLEPGYDAEPLSGPEPPWILSDPITEMRSTFIARSVAVTSPQQANHFVAHLLAADRRVRAATHNITAWRIRGPNGASFQDCNDDGETAAGGRLLHLMQLMDLWDTMVVVTRWYGGQKLGPRRFALINMVARDAFIKAGLVANTASSGKKKGK